MMKSVYLRTASVLVGLVLVTGCGSKAQAPAGQVAATIDGEEVTLQELNTEVQAGNFPDSVDKKVAQQVALQRVIDRKLVIKAATEKMGKVDSKGFADALHGLTITAAKEPGILMDATFDQNGDIDRQGFLVEIVEGKQVVKQVLPKIGK